MKAIGQRELVCINAKQAGVLLGPGFNLVWCAQSRLTRRVRGFFRSAFDTFFRICWCLPLPQPFPRPTCPPQPHQSSCAEAHRRRIAAHGRV